MPLLNRFAITTMVGLLLCSCQRKYQEESKNSLDSIQETNKEEGLETITVAQVDSMSALEEEVPQYYDYESEAIILSLRYEGELLIYGEYERSNSGLSLREFYEQVRKSLKMTPDEFNQAVEPQYMSIEPIRL